MEVREFRVRYELETANGRKVVNGVICGIDSLKYHVEGVKEVGYRLVGIDERYRKHNQRMECLEGWKKIKDY